MFRHVAPAGAPLTATDLVRWAAKTLTSRNPAAALAEDAAARFGVGQAFPTCTGRAGLTILLKALRRLAPDRTEVVLPAYTCYSVAASVAKAGLRPRIVDVATDALDYAAEELEATDFGRVLAIVATNLYGLPNDLPRWSALARARGVFLVDDAAQAMGATVGGRLSGTWGDAGLFSFDKGKNVSAIDGGLIVTSSPEVAGAVQAEMDGLPRPGAKDAGMLMAKALVYFAMLRPWLYWIPNSMPQLELGRTVYTTDFPLARPSRPQAALALTMLSRLDRFTEERRARAAAVLALERTGVTPLPITPGSSPVYLRLPLLARTGAERDRLLDRFAAAGIGATGSYPRSIAELAEVESAPGARRPVAAPEVARRILTLPTHRFVTARDVHRIAEIIGPPTSATSGALASPPRRVPGHGR